MPQISPVDSIFRSSLSMNKQCIIDPSLESGQAGSCELLIVADNEALQLSLVEKKTLKILAFEKIVPENSKDWSACLNELKEKSELITKFPFTKVKIAVYSNTYTLVPDALFKSGNEHTYYRLNYSTDIHSLVYSGQVIKYHLHSIYGISSELINALTVSFPENKTIHFSEVLLNNRFLNSRTDSPRTLSVNVRDHHLDLMVSEGKKLVLLNSFVWQTIEDVLYYSLFVCEQLELNPEQIQVELSGAVERNSALYKLLDKYFASIRFAETLPGLKTGYGLETVPFHLHPVLFGLSLCE